MVAVLAAVALGAGAHAATPAGSTITNVATGSATIGTATTGIGSNPATLRVEELLDIALQSPLTTAGLTVATVTGVPYSLRNAGNGTEAFLLQGTVDATSAAFVGFAIDSNGNGSFDSTDLLVANGGATAALAAGQTITLFALVRADAAGSGTLTVAAQAATGSGTPGTLFAGKGDGGSDAIVGATTAAARLVLPFAATTTGGGTGPDATLVKSASVLAPDGSATPVSGAIVTYTIAASFPEAARGARITDPVPDGTDYVPASLRLDGVALSDADDADAGTVAGNAIAVALGDVAAPAVRTLSFQVKLK